MESSRRSLPAPSATRGFGHLRPQSGQIPPALPGRVSHIFLLNYFHLPHPVKMLPSLRPSHVARGSITHSVGPHLLPGGHPAHSGRVLPDPVV